ncbi:hypothetical protein KSMBR1_1495 [Candidatus Kuenenia stuttgartiensis]|uniref:Uncharacterized protein n=1 Tax=Kuenenia stuttgartiensis TaxID=174633 RepID=A0A2C9CE00_KUEST|nr:hypothetical protein KSMBR1_1495 [Candidatus Kuenenia stuttgartiensis]
MCHCPNKVFSNLVEVAKENIDVISEFNALKQEELGIEALHFYDNYVPWLVKLLKIFL